MEPASWIALIGAIVSAATAASSAADTGPYQPLPTGPRPGGPQRPTLSMQEEPERQNPLPGAALDLALAGLNAGMQTGTGISATPTAEAAQEEMRRMTQQTGAYPSPMATHGAIGSVRPYAPMYEQYGQPNGRQQLGWGY